MRHFIEDLHRDEDPPVPVFECHYCHEVVDCDEAVVLTRHPEMPRVCLNCACSS